MAKLIRVWDGSAWQAVGVVSAQGVTGPTGPTGAASTVPGPTGATGPTGPAGGPTGPTGPGYLGVTSTTSNSIGTGSKTFTITAGSAFSTGARVRAANTASPINYIEGIVTVSGTTMTMTADATGGSGTYTDWTMSIAGNAGSGGGVSSQDLNPPIFMMMGA